MKILIVDDSSVLRDELRTHLEKGFDCIVSEAQDGKEGLALAKSNQYDLIITDFNMPVMSGIDMAKQIRQMENYNQIPIGMLTTESSPLMRETGKQVGIDFWIVKPVEMKKFVSLLPKVFDIRK
ncbi:MAG: response regulator [Zetaproteobacteria bacterium]|nr:response regulator [Pseudobdellovibrionaceae bacterium]